MEWYDPEAITTRKGALEVTLSRKKTHDLNFQGGMMSTWNKFCFTGGVFLASVTLPGINNVAGLWPAVWAMGNLGAFNLPRIHSSSTELILSISGRAGYGASLEGMVRSSLHLAFHPGIVHDCLPSRVSSGPTHTTNAMSEL